MRLTSHTTLVAALLVASAASCKIRPPRFDAPKTQEGSLEQATAPIMCPGGTVLTGLAPPDGFEQWCVKEPGEASSPKQGPWTQWYPAGQMKAEGAYDNDAMTGEWTYYHSNGQMAQRGERRGGERTGRWIYWNVDGEKSAEGSYVDDRLVEQWTYARGADGEAKTNHVKLDELEPRVD